MRGVPSKERIDRLNADAWEVMLQDGEAAAGMAREAGDAARRQGYAEGLASAQLNEGLAESYLSHYDKSLPLLLEAHDRFRRLNDQVGVMMALNALGIVYANLGNLAKAQEYYYDCLNLARNAGNTERETAALNNLGELFVEMGRTGESLEYFLPALDRADAGRNLEHKAHVHGNLGHAYRLQGHWDEAAEHLSAALDLAQSAGDRYSYAEWSTELGLVAAERGDIEAAHAAHRRCIDLSRETGNKTALIHGLQNLGSLHHRAGRNDAAMECFQEAVAVGEDAGLSKAVGEAYAAMSEILELAGDFARALAYQKRLSGIRNRTLEETSSRRLRSLSVQHEIEQAQREAEIYRLRNVELKEKSEALDQAYRRMSVLSEIGLEIARVLDLNELLEAVYRHVNQMMDATIFGIALLSGDGTRLRYELFIEDGVRLSPFEKAVEPVETFGAWVVTHRREIFMNDVQNEYSRYIPTRAQRADTQESNSIIYYPLSYGDRVTGVMSVQSLKKNAYGEETIDALRVLSSYISIAIDNSVAHAELQRLTRSTIEDKNRLEEAYERISYMANHDNLTGLPNRRLLRELMEALLRNSEREASGFGVFYFDLDDFKPINDELGHAAGDEVLVELSRRLREALRRSDVVSRVGGDEFVALARESRTETDLQSVADKILECLGRPFQIEEKTYHLSASIGIAVYPDDDQSIDGLLRKADVAMYATKSRSKHAATFYRDLQQEERLVPQRPG